MFAYERNSQWLYSATSVLVVACLILAMGGWSLLQRGWPAVVFLGVHAAPARVALKESRPPRRLSSESLPWEVFS